MKKGGSKIFARESRGWVDVSIHRAGSRLNPNSFIGDGYIVGTNGFPVHVIRLMDSTKTVEKWRGKGTYNGENGDYAEGDIFQARISNLAQVSVYYVRYNQIKALPFNLGDLINTRSIGLRNNGIAGLGTVDLSNLHFLINLDLSGNGSVTEVHVSPLAPINFYYLLGTSIGEATKDKLIKAIVDSGVLNGTMAYDGRPSNAATDDYNTCVTNGWTMPLGPLGYIAVATNSLSYTESLHSVTVIAGLGIPVIADAGVMAYSETLFTPTITTQLNALATVEVMNYSETIYPPTIETITIVKYKPDADDAVGTWTVAPLWSKVNDELDATFITSTNENNLGSTTISLAQLPFYGGTSNLIIRATKDAGGTAPQLIIEFRDGTTILHTITPTIVDGIANYTLPITSVLTTGGNYNVRLERTGGGSPTARKFVRVYDMWLSILTNPHATTYVGVQNFVETLQVPTITAIIADVTVLTEVQIYTETLFAPTILTPVSVTADATLQAFTETIFSPTVSIVGQVTTIVEVQTFTETIFAPTISAVRNEIGIAAIQTYSETLFAPTVVAIAPNVIAIAGLVTFAETLFAPSIVGIRNETGIAALQTYSETLFAPTILLGGAVNITAIAALQTFTENIGTPTVIAVQNLNFPSLIVNGGWTTPVLALIAVGTTGTFTESPSNPTNIQFTARRTFVPVTGGYLIVRMLASSNGGGKTMNLNLQVYIDGILEVSPQIILTATPTWYEVVISSAVYSNATNYIEVRPYANATGGGSPTTARVHELFTEHGITN
jgi:hypothetical protein